MLPHHPLDPELIRGSLVQGGIMPEPKEMLNPYLPDPYLWMQFCYSEKTEQVERWVMPRSKSSGRWLKEHFGDEFVKKAQQQGYRSRAIYKLMEIDERDRLFREGMTVVDLGAAPGGWSEMAIQKVGPRGKVIAVDILPMTTIPGVDVIQGDFTEQETLDNLIKQIGDVSVDLVLSDMAPNISGMSSVDQPKAVYLAELALELAHKVLAPKGDIVIKLFQGEGFDEFYRTLKSSFQHVKTRKPKASRSRSREVYLLARGYNV